MKMCVSVRTCMRSEDSSLKEESRTVWFLRVR